MKEKTEKGICAETNKAMSLNIHSSKSTDYTILFLSFHVMLHEMYSRCTFIFRCIYSSSVVVVVVDDDDDDDDGTDVVDIFMDDSHSWMASIIC